MHVEVRAYLTLSSRLGDTREVGLSDETTVQNLALKLGFDPGEVGLVLVNGCRADLDSRLCPGDRVAFFPEYVPFHKIYGMCVL
jgi:hypothetical protein